MSKKNGPTPFLTNLVGYEQKKVENPCPNLSILHVIVVPPGLMELHNIIWYYLAVTPANVLSKTTRL